MTKWFRFFQEKTIATIAPCQTDTVLDVGCGTGWAVCRLSAIVPEGRACGVDISSRMIEKARIAYGRLPNIEFKTGDAENIPYGSNVFDVILCTNSFHHYPSPVQALEEFWRVLKPGGRAFILDTVRDGSLLMPIYDFVQDVFFRDHVRYYRARELEVFLKSARFFDVSRKFDVHGLLLHGKLVTSLALVCGRKPASGEA
jgi:ubiquinone/menaquinone biosynthesis C-methylase UbiE